MKVVLGARLAVGVNVAIMVAATYLTLPGTLAPPAVSVKEEVVRVVGFIALLKVAVTIAVLGQTGVVPLGGVTTVTVGGVRGSPGFPVPARLSPSLHPAMTTANKNAGIQILETFNVLISFSSPCLWKAHNTSGGLCSDNWGSGIC
jgi:hypothetical protein